MKEAERGSARERDQKRQNEGSMPVVRKPIFFDFVGAAKLEIVVALAAGVRNR